MKKIVTSIDFGNSKYKSFEADFYNLILCIKLWNNKNVKIDFTNPIKFIYKIDFEIEGLYEPEEETTLLSEALASYYVEVPSYHRFKNYIFLGIDGYPIFEVIAEGFLITT